MATDSASHPLSHSRPSAVWFHAWVSHQAEESRDSWSSAGELVWTWSFIFGGQVSGVVRHCQSALLSVGSCVVWLLSSDFGLCVLSLWWM